METIIKLAELKLEQFVQGTNNNWLIFSTLPESKQHSSGIDGDVILNALKAVEIIDADLDVVIDAAYDYSYSISTDNKLKLAFAKSKHADKGSALDSLKCVTITYELGDLKRNGDYYRVIARDNLGAELHRTNPLTLDQIDKVISTFDSTRDVSTSGYVKYEIKPDFIVN
ncbi:hypothetical protein G7L40_00500 [Paenibacillus polymyxa]|uniref:Uncharacterized protein n=1 Tax=Paenibacillus polymyxa TaxID=1406 RepID=A0A378XUT1_PAEPO|nr:hypothetical protein [Paenibacillus polymyxa]MBE7897190.1 hypothetical protein [Paenibacillus polymyxa]MBG9763046.1 hypothetical protein [Paenibacillus polymyxa]MCC3257560.1 hypothetical protein [Paenibacillus polymyxa]QPK51355.1 hypothetical protein G7035_00500 [Paenibacillus polymyxa]QPK56445.1 hypothetical protein G7L40_00500 [Paenibacillus polymyxa]